MAAESANIPIPSEITMAFAGFLAGVGVMNFWIAVLIGAVGNLVGSLLAFYLGRAMGEEWIRGAIGKWGKWILVHEKDFDTALTWFKKYTRGIFIDITKSNYEVKVANIVNKFLKSPLSKGDLEGF